MGDIADMMLDGTLDEQTGEYLGPGSGYPRTRQPGHYNSMRQHQKHNCYNGIVKFITKHYKQHFPKDFQKEKPSVSLRYFHSIIREYLRENKISHPRGHKYSVVFGNAKRAQKDWPKFQEFLKKRDWSQ